MVEALARASLKACSSLVPQVGIETKRVGQRTAVYGTDAPKYPAVQRVGRVLQGIPWAGKSIDLLPL